MATPHVAGAATLILSVSGTLGPYATPRGDEESPVLDD